MSKPDAHLRRYDRQMRFAPFGEDAQHMIQHAQAVIIGCGALGTAIADTLVRAGVGYVRIIDRDFIELSNLQRQMLFDERDIHDNLPKAEAAARKLRKINSTVETEGVVVDVTHRNIEPLCSDADIILDGTDNFETRYLVNDVAVKLDVPWIYGAAVAAEGMVMPIIPGQTPCLRCVWPDLPPPGSSETCDTAGVMAPVIGVVAGLQAIEALKLLGGKADAVCRKLVTIDVWNGNFRSLDMSASRLTDCPCCVGHSFEFLDGRARSETTSLCGRNAVQITPAVETALDLARISRNLPGTSDARCNEFMLRFRADDHDVTLFPDGRAIIGGTDDPATARGVYARFVGA